MVIRLRKVMVVISIVIVIGEVWFRLMSSVISVVVIVVGSSCG